MFDRLLENSPSSNILEIAAAFRRLGWIGFWLQAFLGFIPNLAVAASLRCQSLRFQR